MLQVEWDRVLDSLFRLAWTAAEQRGSVDAIDGPQCQRARDAWVSAGRPGQVSAWLAGWLKADEFGGRDYPPGGAA